MFIYFSSSIGIRSTPRMDFNAMEHSSDRARDLYEWHIEDAIAILLAQTFFHLLPKFTSDISISLVLT